MAVKNTNSDLDPLILSRKLFYQRFVSLILATILLCGAIMAWGQILHAEDGTPAAEMRDRETKELRYWLNKLTLGLFFNDPESTDFQQLPDTPAARKLLAKTLVTTTDRPVPRGPVAPPTGGS